MEFQIGQTFEGVYPPQAAIWCNNNNCFIEKNADGLYEIKEVIIPELTIEEIKRSYIDAVQVMMDNKAKEKGYDGILSACSYATSKNETFASEAQKCVEWRDEVWAMCYTLLAQVETGAMEQPTVEGLIDMLPKLSWVDEVVSESTPVTDE